MVDQAVEEKKKTIRKAEGEAESALLFGKALKSNPAYLELQRIDAAKYIATRLSRT